MVFEETGWKRSRVVPGETEMDYATGLWTISSLNSEESTLPSTWAVGAEVFITSPTDA
jgi:hypothetical protein